MVEWFYAEVCEITQTAENKTYKPNRKHTPHTTLKLPSPSQRKVMDVGECLQWLFLVGEKRICGSKTYRVEFNTSKFSLKYINDLDYYHI